MIFAGTNDLSHASFMVSPAIERYAAGLGQLCQCAIGVYDDREVLLLRSA